MFKKLTLCTLLTHFDTNTYYGKNIFFSIWCPKFSLGLKLNFDNFFSYGYPQKKWRKVLKFGMDCLKIFLVKDKIIGWGPGGRYWKQYQHDGMQDWVEIIAFHSPRVKDNQSHIEASLLKTRTDSSLSSFFLQKHFIQNLVPQSIVYEPNIANWKVK